MKIFYNYKVGKPFIWFCAVAGIILLTVQFNIVGDYCADYKDNQFNYYMEKYIAAHRSLFVEKQIVEPEPEIQPDNFRDELMMIYEKMKEYPENLSDLIENPKPEKINYKIGSINERDISIKQIVRQNLPTSVLIANEREDGEVANGTGFFIADNGIVVTSYHIFGDRNEPYKINAKRGAVILPENKNFYPIISVLYVDRQKDLIIVKIDGKNKKFPTVKLGDSNLVEPGEKTIIIGNPGNHLNTVVDGLASGFVEYKTIKAIQFSAPITDGNSGGAVFNGQGQAIGVASGMFVNHYGVNLAIPINYLIDLMNKK
jgi:S1-C subfamily serine protease